MKLMNKILCVSLLTLLLVGCREHIVEEEVLPQDAINFTYRVIDDSYQLDFYVGATVQFYPVVDVTTDCVWDFGDGTATITGDTVTHKFTEAGNYRVTIAANGGKQTNVIFISDIKPIVTIIQEDSICEVKSSFVSFEVELPNPSNLDAVYKWTFPQGTINEAGESVDTFEGIDPGKVKFSRVGSQVVQLQVEMGTLATNEMRSLEVVKKNVQVALNVEAPTLYYVVRGGNLMALKLYDGSAEGIEIDPFDMGVSAGQHTFNILYDNGYIYMLDAGMQFNYIDDSDGVKGDGKITVVAKDASTIETMISNVGGPAFQDPFYGCIVGSDMYYSDRNTGVIRIPLKTRNETYNAEKFPYYFQNNRLAYYGNAGLSYGAITGCVGKIGDTWWWAKTYNGNAIWRFKDSDILDHDSSVADKDNVPQSGAVLSGLSPKAFVYDETNQLIYYTLYDANAGIYASTLEEINAVNVNDPTSFTQYQLLFADGGNVEPIVVNGKSEGSAGEYIGICQLALDKQTGDVYFGYRTGNEVPSGLIRVNAQTKQLEHVLKGVAIYGVTINNTPSKLF